MNRDQAKDEAKARIEDYLRSKGLPLKGLFRCLNPAHPDAHASMSYDRDRQRVRCFACEAVYDIFDLVGLDYGLQDFPAKLAKTCELYNIPLDDQTGGRRDPAPKTQPKPAQEVKAEEEQAQPPADFMDYFKACAERLASPEGKPGRDYLTKRGISEATAQTEVIGYDPAYYFPANNSFKGGQYPAIILLSSAYCRVARNIDPSAPETARYAKKGKYSLYGGMTLPYAKTPVFVTEGEFDAISIKEAGGEAVALGSASNWRLLVDAVKDNKPVQPFILALDNDETGRRATEKLKAEFEQLQIVFTLPAGLYGSHKDANEALTAERAAFAARVKAAETEAAEAWEEAKGKSGLLTPARAMRILDEADEEYLEMPHFPQLSKMAKIKTHDTIVIAADTGAGKSSLSLNILHDLQDRYPALYVNLEMDAATVLQRLIAIHTGIELDRIEGYKRDKNTREEVNAAIREITARKEVQLLEDVYNLADIEKEIQAATRDRKEPTIVFIDTGLLVTTANRSASRYERFTQISEELRRISRLNNIVMFVLLQQNRAGKSEENKEPANSSLKESGSWENDATKIIFLWQNPETQKKELSITKNRSGKIGKITLDYAPHTQTYKEPKSEFLPLSEQEAEQLPFNFDVFDTMKEARNKSR